MTRLDTFLRPKIVRYILSQNQGIDFSEILKEKKILLIKLSQGLIGEENSYLLGTMFLSKIQQIAQNRQSLPPKERHPFYIYLDEFQNFITPSISSILSGARKYGIGLILAHQELNQIKDAEISNSVLSNANVRICFRLGDFDARKLESGFSYFDSNDLQNLNVGQAIGRVGRNADDFSLNTFLLEELKEDGNQKFIVENTRQKYSKPISEIENILNSLLSDFDERKSVKKEFEQKNEVQQEKIEIEEIKEKEVPEEKPIKNESPIDNPIVESGKEYIKHFTNQEEIKEHRYLQTLIKKMAEQRGFKASIEESVEDGRVDVSLMNDSIKIACEIAVSNSIEYEIKNIKKCLKAKYSFVCVISKNEIHLEKIKEEAKLEIEEKEHSRIYFFTPNEINNFLDDFTAKEEKEVKRIKGYRVKVTYKAVDPKELDEKNQEITKSILKDL